MRALEEYLHGNSPEPKEKLAKLEEGLSLPKIPEKPSYNTPKSSMQARPNRKSAPKNFHSETTLSPEQ